MAQQAKGHMDSGFMDQDQGYWCCLLAYPNEMYAMTFAFMYLIENDPSVRADYGLRAKTLLMKVITEAAKGVQDGTPFRDHRFSTSDRAHFWGEAWGLTVDWIYPLLSADDKAKIRTVFLRWSQEISNSYVTGIYAHPTPIGLTNDPSLFHLDDPSQFAIRFAVNNHFTFHMRNMGLMALSLDAADDPGNQLGSYVSIATGAWLYMTDYMMRNQLQEGGDWPEGWAYTPSGLGAMLHFMLALKTSGRDNPSVYGPQVVVAGNPFLAKIVPAYIHSFSTVAKPILSNEYLGNSYEPAWFGDGDKYWSDFSMKIFGALGLIDYYSGSTSELQTIRWIERNLIPGGEARLLNKISGALGGSSPRDAIFAFLLFDPAAAAPPDPRPALPKTYFGEGINRILARTSWGADASWLTYKLTWNRIDHQHGDGNMIEFYRKGEWLTKNWVGYGAVAASSDFKNTLAIENDPPSYNDPDSFQNVNWLHGSQWQYISAGDPVLVGKSFNDEFLYVTGDATKLYNSTSDHATATLHASRSLVWLKPDHVVVYDRAKSKSAGYFKRFWLNFSTLPVIVGKRATATTPEGQKFYVTSVLPANAALSTSNATQNDVGYEQQASGERMKYRLRVEAPGEPAEAEFLHVLQGADAGVSAVTPQLLQSQSGNAFEGVILDDVAVLFPKDLGLNESVTYRVPAGVQKHIVTGLPAGTNFSTTVTQVGAETEITIDSGGGCSCTDDGGVLKLDSDEIAIPSSGLWCNSTCNGGKPCPPAEQIDTDADGILNCYDNCADDPNINQEDTDADGEGNLCDADDDDDEVSDSQEALDGSHASDRGSSIRVLGTELCSEWNGFLDGMFNVMEHVNMSVLPKHLQSTLHNLQGEPTQSTDLPVLNAGTQYDHLVHAMNGWKANSYGRVCTEVADGAPGDIDGRMVYYKTGVRSNRPECGFQFAFAMPFLPGIKGTQVVPYNTYQPSLAGTDAGNTVANWIQLSNLEATPQSGFLYYYALNGAVLGKESVALPAAGRHDYAAHQFGASKVGLVEWRPTNRNSHFQLRNVRYLYDNAQLENRFATAFQLDGMIGSGQTLVAPLDSAGASAILEISNTTKAKLPVSVRIYSSAGVLLQQLYFDLAAHASQHIITDSILNGAQGIAVIKGGSLSSVVATAMHYGRTEGSQIRYMFGISATQALGSTLRGSYNTYLGQACRLFVANPGNSATQVTIEMKRSDGTQLLQGVPLAVPAHGLADYNLCANDSADHYGVVTVHPQTANSVTATVVRQGVNDCYRFPTNVRQ